MKYIKIFLMSVWALFGFTFSSEPETFIQFKDVYDNGIDDPSIKNTYRIVSDNCLEDEGPELLVCDYSIQYDGIFGSEKALNINPETGIYIPMDMEVQSQITAGWFQGTLIDDNISTDTVDAIKMKTGALNASDVNIFDVNDVQTITISGGEIGDPYNEPRIEIGVEKNGVYISSEFITVSDAYSGASIHSNGVTANGVYVNEVEAKSINANEINAGSIIAKQWQIEPPDYVFEPEYELPALDKVESYIKKHKHLPEIPSGQEIKDKGLDLGAMNLMLLKKVEELTLYSIEQEKKLQEQRSRLDQVYEIIKNMKQTN